MRLTSFAFVYIKSVISEVLPNKKIIIMGIYTSKRCPKCGKTFIADHYFCPNCNPKTSIVMSGLSLLNKLLGGK